MHTYSPTVSILLERQPLQTGIGINLGLIKMCICPYAYPLRELDSASTREGNSSPSLTGTRGSFGPSGG